MRSGRLRLALAAFLALGTCPAFAAEIYVDKSYGGNDSDGSLNKPYKTIQAGVDAVPVSGTHDLYIRVVPNGGNTEVETEYQEANGVVVAGKNIRFTPYRVQGQTQDGIVKITRPGVGVTPDPPGGNGADGAPTLLVKTSGRVELTFRITVVGQAGGNASGIAFDGGKGGPGVQADNDGGTRSVIVLTGPKVDCIGGRGGNSTNGGTPGDGGPGERANGGKIVNANGGDSKGGKSGDPGVEPQELRAGTPPVVFGGQSGDGGPGVEAVSGGLIEIDDASQVIGGEATGGGTDGPARSHDGSSSIVDLADGSYCVSVSGPSPTCTGSCSVGDCTVVGVELPGSSSWGLAGVAMVMAAFGAAALRSRRPFARAA